MPGTWAGAVRVGAATAACMGGGVKRTLRVYPFHVCVSVMLTGRACGVHEALQTVLRQLLLQLVLLQVSKVPVVPAHHRLVRRVRCAEMCSRRRFAP